MHVVAGTAMSIYTVFLKVMFVYWLMTLIVRLVQYVILFYILIFKSIIFEAQSNHMYIKKTLLDIIIL